VINHEQFKQLSLFPAKEAGPRSRRKPKPEVPSGWSGQLPGQTVLPPDITSGESLLTGKHGPEGGYLFHDRHGNISEEGASSDWDPSSSIEGAYQERPKLMDVAKRQPVTHVRTDAPLHTLQPEGETEHLYDIVHGDERRKKLDLSIALHGVHDPILLVRHQNRHIIIDGHHRLLAARKAGHPTVPAQIFDHDAHVARGGAPIIKDTESDPYDISDLEHGHSGYDDYHSGDFGADSHSW
jgi:hypothetical protein